MCLGVWRGVGGHWLSTTNPPQVHPFSTAARCGLARPSGGALPVQRSLLWGAQLSSDSLAGGFCSSFSSQLRCHLLRRPFSDHLLSNRPLTPSASFYFAAQKQVGAYLLTHHLPLEVCTGQPSPVSCSPVVFPVPGTAWGVRSEQMRKGKKMSLFPAQDACIPPSAP